jgi:hypothetical protein
MIRNVLPMGQEGREDEDDDESQADIQQPV